jgi:hypothetical protein
VPNGSGGGGTLLGYIPGKWGSNSEEKGCRHTKESKISLICLLACLLTENMLTCRHAKLLASCMCLHVHACYSMLMCMNPSFLPGSVTKPKDCIPGGGGGGYFSGSNL